MEASDAVSEVVLGVFTANVRVFGIVVVILLCIIGIGLYFFIKNAIRKVSELEDLHDDIVAVKLQDEGRRSFTGTLTNMVFKVEQHEKRLDKIDDRCDRRHEFNGVDRRAKDENIL